MIIKDVESLNFKGDPLLMDIPSVLVLTGENGSGKSRIPEAIITAIQGSIPWTRYKTAAAIYEKFRTVPGDAMKLQVTLSDDVQIRRTIKKAGSTVKQKLDYRGNTKLQDAQAMVDADLNICAEALDFAKFENMTPREQQLYLLGLVQIPDEFEKDSLREQIAESLLNASKRHYKSCEKCQHCIPSVEGFKGNDPLAHRSNNAPMGYGECDLEVGKQVKLIDPGCANWKGFDDWEDDLKALFGIGTDITIELFEAWDDNKGIRENIESLEKRSREMKTEVQNNVNRLMKLNEAQIDSGMKASREADKPQGITGTTAQIKTKLDALRETEKKLIADIEKETAKATAHTDWLKDHRNFQDDVDKGNTRLNQLLQDQREGKFEAKAKAVKKKIQTEEWYEQKQKELNAMEAKRSGLDHDRKEAEGVVEKIRAEIKTLETSKLKFSEDKVQCPICPSMGCPTTKKQKQKIVDDVTPEITKLEKELVPATKKHDQAKADFEQVLHEIQILTTEINGAKANDASYESRVKEFQGSEKNLKEAITTANDNLKIYDGRLAGHLENDKRVDSSDDSGKLETEKTEAQDSIKEYQAAYDVKVDEDRREADRKRTIADLEEARERLILAKELVKIVGPSGILGSVLSASLTPMIDSINEFLPDGRSCFIMPAGSGIDIGMSIDGNDRSLMSQSDGEKSLFLAAAALAFMVHRESNLKLLVVNQFERIDKNKQVALLKKIVPASEKYGIQFIGCSCWPTPPVEGVEIIEMEGDA